MLNIDLSFAYYESTIYKGSYLYAHSEHAFHTAEPTSDHLMFYGFGSGIYVTDHARVTPKWISEFKFHNLPDIKNLQQNYSFMKHSDATALIINDYVFKLRDIMFMQYAMGFVPDRAVIKRLIQQLCCIIRCDISYTVVDNIVSTILLFAGKVPDQSDGYLPSDTCLVSGINKYGNHYMYVGFPRTNTSGVEDEAEDRDGSPSWKYASEMGPLSNALNTLRSLRTTKFTNNLGPEYFDDLINKVRVIEPHTY